jgi:hypothetical protein
LSVASCQFAVSGSNLAATDALPSAGNTSGRRTGPKRAEDWSHQLTLLLLTANKQPTTGNCLSLSSMQKLSFQLQNKTALIRFEEEE